LVIAIIVLTAGIYAFVVLTKIVTQRLSSHTDRTAEDFYDSYGDRRSRGRDNKA
jgi:hypothetical protein